LDHCYSKIGCLAPLPDHSSEKSSLPGCMQLVDYPTNHMYAAIGKERIKKCSLAQAIFFFVRLHATKKNIPTLQAITTKIWGS
jgi:hypothetical protein